MTILPPLPEEPAVPSSSVPGAPSIPVPTEPAPAPAPVPLRRVPPVLPEVPPPEPLPAPGVEPSPAPIGEPSPPPAALPAAPPAAAAPSTAPPAVEPAPDTSFKFAASREQRVDELVRALRARPEDTSLPCWPASLLTSAPASTGLSRGDRPALVIFYDDTAKASRLAAADLWPVVLEVETKVDVVLVDLTPGSKHTLSDDEKRLVRRYYTGYVPTTVVLTSDRVPRLLKSERVEPALVRAACLEAR